jgi:OOP family OmpA-OmpF porin
MSRGLITALLAALFYGGLLFWAVAWKRADTEKLLASSRSEASRGSFTNSPASPATEPGDEQPAAESVTKAPAVDLEPARFAAEQDAEGRWEIDGRLASQADADAIRSALNQDGAEILGEIVIAPETDAAPWAKTLSTWLPLQLEKVASYAGIAVIDGQLLVAGEVYSQEDADALLAAASSHFAKSGLELESQFDVVAPPQQPELAIAPDGNGGLRIAGRMRDADLKTRLIELITQVGEGMPVEEEISIGNDVAKADWASSVVQVIPGLITEVSNLQLMASGGVFMMAGTVSADTTKAALGEMTTQAFEGVSIRIDNQLTVAAEPEPASLSISRGDDGVLHLSGLLNNQADAKRFLTAAKEQVSDQAMAPTDDIEVRQDVAPAPWLNQMVELVPPFAAAVGWGALSIHGDQVALEAQVADPENADVLSAIVKNAFPEPAFKRVVEVSVAAPAGPSDEDIAMLDRLIAETVVYFDSSSAKVRKGDLGKLEQLAAALDAVPGSGIALLGHADPKGNAAFNRKLSKRRCESVRVVLEGYGIDFLLMEIEEKGETSGSSKGHESGRRVEFEIR